MLMSLMEGEWAMHVPNNEDNGQREAPAVEKDEEMNEVERVRALQNLARKMDKLLLSWSAKRRTEGGEKQC